MKQKKGFTGNRYSASQKRMITRFVKEHDDKHGRGGIAAALRKFRISYIALRSWLAGNSKRKHGVNFNPVLDRLASLKAQLKELEREIRRLRRGF